MIGYNSFISDLPLGKPGDGTGAKRAEVRQCQPKISDIKPAGSPFGSLQFTNFGRDELRRMILS